MPEATQGEKPAKKAAVHVARPEKHMTHKVAAGKKPLPSWVREGEALNASYLKARDAYVRWGHSPEENGRIYVAQWCRVLAQANPSWAENTSNASAAIDIDKWTIFMRGRVKEDRRLREETEAAAKKLVAWLREHEKQFRSSCCAAVGAIPRIVNGLSESPTGRAWLASQLRRTDTLFAWLARAKPEEEAKAFGEQVEKVKGVFELTFAEALGEAALGGMEKAHEISAESGEFQVLDGWFRDRYGVALCAVNKHIVIGGYLGKKPVAVVVPHVWFDDEAMKRVKLAGSVLSHLGRGLAILNFVCALHAVGEKHDLNSYISATKSGVELLGNFTAVQKNIAEFYKGPPPDLRAGQFAEAAAKAGEEAKAGKSLLSAMAKGFGESAGEVSPIGVFCAACDVVLSSMSAAHAAMDGNWGTARAETGAAVSGVLTMVGLAMLPVPGLNLVGMGLVVSGTVGGFVCHLIGDADKDAPLQAWARHSSFGTSTSGSPEQQIERLRDLMFQVRAKASCADGTARLSLELSNVSAQMPVGLQVRANGAVIFNQSPARPGATCRFEETADGGLKGIELEHELDGESVDFEVVVRISLDDGQEPLIRKAAASARQPLFASGRFPREM